MILELRKLLERNHKRSEEFLFRPSLRKFGIQRKTECFTLSLRSGLYFHSLYQIFFSSHHFISLISGLKQSPENHQECKCLQ